jgi:hypothetical protein
MSRDRRATDHETFDELAVGWALHALEPEDEAVFAAHLPGCERCARTIAETSDVMAAMASDLPVAEPSQDLRRRLAEAVEQTEQIRRPEPEPRPVEDRRPAATGPRPVTRLVPAPSRWRRALPTTLIAAAVAAILGLGIWNVTLAQQQENLKATVAEQSAVMSELLSSGQAAVAPLDQVKTGTTSTTTGKTLATVVARNNGVDVVATGLSVNDPAANTYVLWGMRGNTPVPLGTFDVVQSRLDLRTVGSAQSGLDRYTTFGVSLEPGRKAPAAPTHMVALGQVSS